MNQSKTQKKIEMKMAPSDELMLQILVVLD
jgi:hypothetical protein